MDGAAARAAITDGTRRFADLFRSAPDPEQPVVRSDWCVREVAAHVFVITESFERYLTGDTTPVIDLTDLPTTNPTAIATVQERDVATLADGIERGTARFLELTDGRGLDEPMWWHGEQTTIGAVYGIYLGELLMHGDDVARTLRRPWPISAGDATIVFEGVSQIVHLFLDPARAQHDATFEIRLRTGPSFVLPFSNGKLRVQAGRARDADCRISADPAALVPVLYRRRSQWGAIARGRLVAFGRRPWLAFRLKDRFGGF
jgi:uncharacterized protein (TIGR03083 family)